VLLDNMNTMTIEEMKGLDSKLFRMLGLKVAELIISSNEPEALINYNNWNKAQKQRFLESMK